MAVDYTFQGVLPLLRVIGETILEMDKVVHDIGRSEDTPQRRRKFLKQREEVNKKISEVTELVKRSGSSRPEIESELELYVQRFKDVVDLATRRFPQTKPQSSTRRLREKATIQRQIDLRISSASTTTITRRGSNSSSEAHDDCEHYYMDDSDLERTPLLGGRTVSRAQMQEQMREPNTDWHTLESQAEGMQFVKGELVQMHGAYQTMGEMVGSQQENLDLLSTHVVGIRDDAKAGTEHLYSAHKYATKSRRARCYIFLSLFIAMAALLGFIYITKYY